MVNGSWTNELLDDSLQRISPIATLDLTDAAAKIQYQDTTKTKTFWRVVTDGAEEHQITVKGYSAGARRWVPGTGKVILTGKAASGYNQIFLFDTESGQTQQLTDENGNVSGAMMWQAPSTTTSTSSSACSTARCWWSTASCRTPTACPPGRPSSATACPRASRMSGRRSTSCTTGARTSSSR
jgi:hypothetical protein